MNLESSLIELESSPTELESSLINQIAHLLIELCQIGAN